MPGVRANAADRDAAQTGKWPAASCTERGASAEAPANCQDGRNGAAATRRRRQSSDAGAHAQAAAAIHLEAEVPQEVEDGDKATNMKTRQNTKKKECATLCPTTGRGIIDTLPV